MFCFEARRKEFLYSTKCKPVVCGMKEEVLQRHLAEINKTVSPHSTLFIDDTHASKGPVFTERSGNYQFGFTGFVTDLR